MIGDDEWTRHHCGQIVVVMLVCGALVLYKGLHMLANKQVVPVLLWVAFFAIVFYLGTSARHS